MTSKTPQTLEIAATDGTKTIRLLRLEQKPAGFHASFFLPGIELRRSYQNNGHVVFQSLVVTLSDAQDGTVHTAGHSKKILKADPLASFRGFFNLLSEEEGISQDLFLRSDPLRFQKTNRHLILDTRHIGGSQVRLSVDLVEPDSTRALTDCMTHFQKTCRPSRLGEHHLYRDFQPWVLVQISFYTGKQGTERR